MQYYYRRSNGVGYRQPKMGYPELKDDERISDLKSRLMNGQSPTILLHLTARSATGDKRRYWLPKEELNRFAVVDTEDLWGNPRIKNYWQSHSICYSVAHVVEFLQLVGERPLLKPHRKICCSRSGSVPHASIQNWINTSNFHLSALPQLRIEAYSKELHLRGKTNKYSLPLLDTQLLKEGYRIGLAI